MIDPGAHTGADDETTNWRRARHHVGPRLVSVTCTIVGFVIASVFLAVVVDTTRKFIARITEGRSEVVERDHFVIVGFSEKCIPTIAEMCKDMESEGGGVIVVMADTIEKADFDERAKAYLARVPLRHASEVIFRPGNPLFSSDLIKIAVETARSVIILSDMTCGGDHADFKVE